MAGGSLDFLINIQQKLSGGNVGGQLGELEKRIKGESAALSQLEASMRRMQQGTSINVDAYRQLQEAIEQKKQGLAQLSQRWTELGGAQEGAAAGAESFGSKLTALKAGPVGMLVGALVALIAIIGVATYKLASFALEAAGAARSLGLMLEGAAGSVAGGRAVADAVGRVAAKSAVAKEEIARMAQALAMAGLSGAMLEKTLQQLANVSTVAGPAAAGVFEEITKGVRGFNGKVHFEVTRDQLRQLGLSMDDLAKKFGKSARQLEFDMKTGKVSVEKGVGAMNELLQKRFGATAEKALLGFDVQMLKLKENLAKLFADVKIEPFLKALKEVLSVFDANTVTGKALHYIITEVFSGLFAALAKAGPYIKAFFGGMLIGLLYVYIYAKKAWRALSEATQGLGGINGIKVAMWGGIIVVGLFIAAIAALVVVLFTLSLIATIPFLLMLAPVLLIIGVIYLFIRLIQAIGEAFTNVKWPDWTSAGTSMVDGLVNGLQAGIGRIVAAVVALGSAAKATLQRVLDIHSPSRVMAKMGRFTSEGFAEGVDDGADKAQSAMADMASPSAARGGASRGGVRAGGVHIEHLHIHGHGAADLWEQLEEKLVALVERSGLAGPAPEGT